jgi:ABC-2 type transport system ATP-binding protein
VAPAVKTVGLTKNYEDFPAVIDVNMEIPEGTLYGLIGPNGAGKTTIIKMLTCLLSPTAGEAYVNGFSVLKQPLEVKRSVGYLAEDSNLYEDMTVTEYLDFFADVYELSKDVRKEAVKRHLETLGLSEYSPMKIGNLSKGLKRRVAIVRALLNNPKLLICDEVTSGLDPLTIRLIWDYLKQLVSQGTTVLISTHNLYEANVLCSEVFIINKGRRVDSGPIKELAKKYLKNANPEERTSELENIFFSAIAKSKT